MSRRPRSATFAAVVAVGALGLAACTSGGGVSESPAREFVPASERFAGAFDLVNADARVTGPITVGYQDSGSSQVMAEVYAKVLEEAGFDVQMTVPARPTDLIDAMQAGVVDVIPTYTGEFAITLYQSGHDAADLPPWMAEANAQTVVNDLGASIGIEMLDFTPANDDAFFVVSKEFSEEYGITTLSQLAEWSRTHPLRLGADETCETRPYCEPNLENTYGLQIKDFVTLPADGTIVKSTLLNGGAELGWLSGSDPATDSPDLVVLEEDKALNIFRNIAPVIRRAIATPEVVEAMNAASAKVTTERLNAMVDSMHVDGSPSAKVAAEFVAEQGLGEGLYTGPTEVVSVAIPTNLPAPPTTPPPGGPLRISYAPLTDTEIAAYVYGTALRRAGIDVAIGDAQDPEDILAAMSTGEVQFAPMRLHAIANILNTQANGVLATPIEDRSVDRMASTTRDLATPRGMTILGPSAANVGSAWTVTDDFVHNTGIDTLSELARVSQQRPITLGGPSVCPERAWCQPFLQDKYEVKVGQFVPLDWGGGLTRAAIDKGEIDVGWLDGNDGGIAEFGFRALIDDLGRESVNPITPVLNTMSVTPEITKVVDSVSAVLTTADLQEMNYAVEFERRDIQDVVDEFLAKHNLG